MSYSAITYTDKVENGGTTAGRFGAVGDGVTDSAGVIEYRSILSASGINYKILCYQKLA